MNYFKRFSQFAKPYKSLWVISIALNILYALFTTLSYIVLMPTLNILFGETKKVENKPIYNGFLQSLNKEYLSDLLNYYVTYTNKNFGSETTLLYIVFAVVLIFMLKNIFSYLGQLSMVFLKNSVLKDLRKALFKKIISLDLPFFSKRKKGDILNRATGDISIINETYLNLVISLIREPLNIAFTLIFMVKTSWQLSVFIFTFIPIAGLVISVISKKIKQQSSKIFLKNGYLLGMIEESLSGLKIVKAFNAENIFLKRFTSLANELMNLSNKMSKREVLAGPVSEFLGVITIAGLLWYGGKMVLIDKTLLGGTFIAFMAAAYNVLTPAKAIAKAYNNVKVGNAASQRVFEVLDSCNSVVDADNADDINSFNTKIEFKNVWFKYDNVNVLKNFSLIIPKGKSVALVGQSGSGKSTLVNLLTRFYDVNKGGIFIDDINIKQFSKSSLRNLMGVVTQNPTLFNDTVANNIALGSTANASIDEIKSVAEIANAHEFIKYLPKDYFSHIGEAGGNLSGGQQQRIAIARAVLKKSPIMILDEATSALDTESEKLVQDALEKMMQGRTSVVIAHRLSTIKKADLIVVLKKGKIVEQGKHNELLNKQGEYYKLVTLQNIN
ncbi:MAG: ABC transporter ATP-binding protein [Tenacibaculum sp.]